MAYSEVDWFCSRRSIWQAKELPMIPSDVASVPAELPQKEAAIADRGVHRPMSQQHADHGHQMHPQKLVRLIGCHDPSSAVKREAA
jgi:hypothetical protein